MIAKGIFEYSHRIIESRFTSSPSPRHSANSIHADQFQGYTAIERMMFSTASSRLESR